jgi:hypothetical protein
VTAHSAQKTPDKFEAKVGEKVPTNLKLDAMPAPLINQEPALKQYDFVKLENDVLVVDPMDMSDWNAQNNKPTCFALAVSSFGRTAIAETASSIRDALHAVWK